MCALLPPLAAIRVRRILRGRYPQTPDGSPIMGSCEDPAGYHYAVGICRQTFILGPGLAADIVGLIRDGRTVTEPEVFALFRLERYFGKVEALK
jgi:glycine/D-amino acid oxidase-like deaminating enzyme